MGKGYEDLSRRALIKLDRDFDQEHDAELLAYLTKHSDNYENKRPIEKLVEGIDNIGTKSSELANTLLNLVDQRTNDLLDDIIQQVLDSANDAEL